MKAMLFFNEFVQPLVTEADVHGNLSLERACAAIFAGAGRPQIAWLVSLFKTLRFSFSPLAVLSGTRMLHPCGVRVVSVLRVT